MMASGFTALFSGLNFIMTAINKAQVALFGAASCGCVPVPGELAFFGGLTVGSLAVSGVSWLILERVANLMPKRPKRKPRAKKPKPAPRETAATKPARSKAAQPKPIRQASATPKALPQP